MNISDNSCYTDNNFIAITQKLESVLNTIDKEKYINILIIVNYESKKENKNKYKENCLFDKIKKNLKI